MVDSRFITFEGGEGTGKSTQVARLRDRLRAAGVPCRITREPGGSPFAEDLRQFILSPHRPAHSALAEAMLFSAARSDHLEMTIRPALADGTWVICDRFADSTRAYQGAAGGLPEDVVLQLESMTIGCTRPDLTIILDLPVSTAFARVAKRTTDALGYGNQCDPYEGRHTEFHEALRQGFLMIAAKEATRCQVIDASPSAEAVAEMVWQAVCTRFSEVNS
ncbi:MAG: dTMP kinase [Hyphomicrobiaceae bacterium]